ncbi:MAG: type III-B CRISPR module-associated protein Cmr5 [Nitrospinae bacterium]|nr:type III-B CRISPR module-associated protein Cmr5 [Nitrospinota bacterium]
MSLITNLEHERAKKAWSCVNDVNSKEKDKFKKEYRSIVMKSPTLIIINGLGQTLAFLKSKGKNDENKPEEKLYRNIESWIDKRVQWTASGELMEKIISLPNDKFRYATAETLSFLSWMKRFADAVLPKEGDE